MQHRPSIDSRAENVAALELIRAGRRFLLVGHERPDGDCLGAQTAMAGVLESLGKEVFIENPDPVQPSLSHLAERRSFRVHRGGALPVHDVVCLLDFSVLSRCGAMAAAVERAGSKILVVDHHVVHGEPFWDAAYLDVRASATGLLVRRIAADLGVELDRHAALGVFTSLVTDTGWFKYSNTDAETLRVAAEMVELGVDPARVHRTIFQRASRSRPHGIARALERLVYHADGRVALVALPPPAAGQAELDDGDEVLDLMRAVETVEVALFLRETRSGAVRLSARSKGESDVQLIASAFGGGGHQKAAGATLEGPVDLAAERVLAQTLSQLRANEARPA